MDTGNVRPATELEALADKVENLKGDVRNHENEINSLDKRVAEIDAKVEDTFGELLKRMTGSEENGVLEESAELTIVDVDASLDLIGMRDVTNDEHAMIDAVRKMMREGRVRVIQR